MIAPTITMPPIISALGSPLLELTNCASPIVPPAPPLLSTVTFLTILSALQRRLQRAPGLIPAAAGCRGHQDLQAFEGERIAASEKAQAQGGIREGAAGDREGALNGSHENLQWQCVGE